MKSKRFKMPGDRWTVVEDVSDSLVVRASARDVLGDLDGASVYQRLDNQWGIRADCTMTRVEAIAFLTHALKKVRAAK